LAHADSNSAKAITTDKIKVILFIFSPFFWKSFFWLATRTDEFFNSLKNILVESKKKVKQLL